MSEKKVDVEIEGGGWTWFYVCGECHRVLRYRVEICPSCKSPLNWSSVELNQKQLYRGEETEPAE